LFEAIFQGGLPCVLAFEEDLVSFGDCFHVES